MIWHIREEDGVRLSAEPANLGQRLDELNARIRAAINRERYSRSPAEAARGAEDRKHLMAELDRLMTRSRAVAIKPLLLQRMAGNAVSCQNSGAQGDVDERVKVEVHRETQHDKAAGQL
jgi:hypothetical protein